GHPGYDGHLVKPDEVIAYYPGGQTGFALLLYPAQAPVSLNLVLEIMPGAVLGFECADQGVKIGLFGFVGGSQPGCNPMLSGGDNLALIHQIDIAAQRRSGPEIIRNPNAFMRQGMGRET